MDRLILWLLSVAIFSIKLIASNSSLSANITLHGGQFNSDKNVKPILDTKNIQFGSNSKVNNSNRSVKMKISSTSKVRLNQDVHKKSPDNFKFSDLLEEISETVTSTTDISSMHHTETDDGLSSTLTSEYYTKPSEVNMTTAKSDINNTTEETSTKPAMIKKTISNYNASFDCSCDLTLNACDISCCCDNECTHKNLAMFPKCNGPKTESPNFDSKYCYSHEMLYKSNIPSVKKAYVDDLFCVLKDNLPPKIEKKENKVINNLQDMFDTSKRFFRWSESLKKNQQDFELSKPYNYNDVVWFLRNDTLTTMEMPYSTYNAYCRNRRPLRFLKNSQSSCISSLPDLEMFDFYDNFESVYFISNPSLFNESLYAENKTCSENVCIPVETHMCDLHNCKEFNSTEHQKTVTCDEVICNNIITKVKFILYADNSGIVHFKILFGIDNIYLSDGYVSQEFEVVNYLTGNFSNSYDLPQHLSGNNGYLIGRPVITSAISNKNYSRSNDNSIRKIDFFNADYTYPLSVMQLPTNIHKRCIFTNITYNQVLFGDNIKSICNLIYVLPKNEENGTFICNMLQGHINSLYSMGNTSIYLSMLGNPWQESNQWIKLLENIFFSPIAGNFSNSETLNCQNLCTSLKYEFAYGILRRQEIKDYKLLGGIKTCVYNENLQLQIIGNEVLLPLTVTMAFYDVSVPPLSEYAKGPSLNLQLPNDFFYPFTSGAFSMHNIQIFSMVFTLYIFFIVSIVIYEI